jgi:hypothetical protein
MRLMPNSAFGWNDQASSASFFSQADMPRSPAFLRYEDFSAAVQRKWTCLEASSLAGFLGAPLRLGGVMADILPTQNSSCNPSFGMI